MSLRIVFMGSPDFAVPALSEIIAAGHELAAVYCQPPRPAGRGQAERKGPVHQLAEQWGLPVLTPKNLKGADIQDAFAAHAADVGVVVAYGLLLPGAVLRAPVHGCLNLHPSALPRWRGAAPLQRTLMAGDAETAIMVMRMDEGLDTGPVCLAEQMQLRPEMTAGELHDLAARRGADLLCRALVALERGSLDCRPQAETGITYAPKIEKAEARINWSLPARAVHDRIRGLSPFPGAWFEIDLNGRTERIKVLRSMCMSHGSADAASSPPGTVLDSGEDGALAVSCGSDAVKLISLQRSGRKPMPAADFLRGMPLPAGTLLTGGPV